MKLGRRQGHLPKSLFRLLLQGAAGTPGWSLLALGVPTLSVGPWNAPDSSSPELSVSPHTATVTVGSTKLALKAEDVSGSHNYR